VLRQMGGIGQVQVPWDGLDEEGDRLAQGTYLYKVYVGAREPDGRTSALQNATSQGRFVVLSP
jgi:flagellar hook assembly protein FlgD